jgi:predicted PurR-regulated permease PerM
VSPLWKRSSARSAVEDFARRARVGNWNARRVFVANLVVLGVLACFALLFRFAAALFILFIGMALGMAVKPGVDGLRRRGVPRWLGALGIYTVLGAIVAGILVTAVPVITDEVSAVVAHIPRRAAGLRAELLSSSSHTLRRIASYLPPAVGRGDSAGLDVATVADYARAVARNGLTIAAVLLLGFYWTLEGDRRIRALALFAPFERRPAIRMFLDDVEHTVGAYLRGQSMVCLVIGVLAFVAYLAIGVPHAGLLGIIYAIGEAVPVVGPIFGTVVAALFAVAVSPALVPWVIVTAVILQLVENYALVPRVMNRTVGVNPLVTLLAISAFGSVLGIAGAVLAIPLAAIVQLLLHRLWLDAETRSTDLVEGRDRLSVVRYEVRELSQDLRKIGGPRAARARRSADAARSERLADAVEGIAYDLDRLLAERERRT